MSHHLTVIINNGVLSTLLGVHIGSTRVAVREREFSDILQASGQKRLYPDLSSHVVAFFILLCL